MLMRKFFQNCRFFSYYNGIWKTTRLSDIILEFLNLLKKFYIITMFDNKEAESFQFLTGIL